jgi:excisionase family DNA binding protein
MRLTEQQACAILQVTPATLSVYVATRRLHTSRRRTIRGLVVFYDKAEVERLKKELQQDQEFIRKQIVRDKHSSQTLEAELVGVDFDSTANNGASSSIPTSTPVIERLISLLEGLTPGDMPKVPIESKLLLSLPEAAAYSGLSEVRLNEAIRSGKLASRRDLGRGHRIKRADLEEYIRSI